MQICRKKTDTIILPVVGSNFNSLGEAYDYYSLYSWEIGFGVGYGKSRLNVERTKCMQEIVYGCSVNTTLEFHASKIYTRAMFDKFGEIMYEATQYWSFSYQQWKN